MALTLLIFVTSTALSFASTHICDGINVACTGSTVNCVDNESCLIQCTGAKDCLTTTVNCPINGSCTIECHNSATRDGCKMSSINATHSLSLLLDNQNVQNGFRDTPIYCPLYGNCSLKGSGKSAYQNIKVYAVFGFVFNTVSLLCTGNCKTNAILYCGNAYNASCLFADDGISCTNAPLTCDTIFTSINGTWIDDYSIHPAPGWIVTNFNGSQIDSVYNGSDAIYHGPFYGNTLQSDIEINSLMRYFYCAYDATVFVQYFYGFSCQEDADYSRLYLDGQLMAQKHAKQDTGFLFKDDKLEILVQNQCADEWNYKILNATLSNIFADTYFELQIDVALNWLAETSVISDIEITCIPPTKAPTANVGPSVSPTLAPSVIPTIAPSVAPITKTPTVSPNTASPTMNTSVPTQDPSIAPVTKGPTTNPSVAPTELPVVGIMSTTGDSDKSGDNFMMDVKLQTLSTEQKDFGPLVVVICIIGSFFVITVVIVCRLWMQHEKAYRPFFNKRKQEMLEMMQTQQENGVSQTQEQDNGDESDEYLQTTK